jgi:YesN/AraC family two-component response regulator
MHDLRCTIVKLANQINFNSTGDAEGIIKRVNDLGSSRTFGDAYRIIENIYESLCGMVERMKRSHRTKLIQDIKGYIEKHYKELSLNRYEVSSQFRMNEEYFSSFFKEQAGIYFSDFLEEIRMKKASLFLSEQDTPIYRIAQAVGYSSVNAFCRAFKRVSGLSPGEYRKIQAE